MGVLNVQWCKRQTVIGGLSNFTPLNIYNGTPSGVPQDVKGQQLPINQLKGKQPTVVCPISNVHRCKCSSVYKI